MSSSPTLPTLDRLGAKIPSDLDVNKIAAEWCASFKSAVQSANVEDLVALLVEDAFWRDLLALTWDFRTFQGVSRIQKFLSDCLPAAQLVKSLNLIPGTVGLFQPYPDLAWIQGSFGFETEVGIGSGIFRLVPLSSGEWKAHSIFTNLEDLKAFPEKIGPLRNPSPNHGKWAKNREKENAFVDSQPDVLIVGGGQSGLDLAARLKCLDVKTLVVEKNKRVGDNWRERYEALCLHDPVWYDHMPYLPFPPTWPVYTPALKLADWLESYAHSLELNVWTSSTVVSATQNPSSKKWIVQVQVEGDKEHQFVVDHLIFAAGIGSNVPNMPKYPGMDSFKGQILHSSQHKKATDHAGKKVVVVGACTSGHDVSADYCQHGVDVTLYQRNPTYVMSTKEGLPRLMAGLYVEGGPPTDVADRVNASFPIHLLKLIQQRVTKDIADADRDLLDGLAKRGFKLSLGMEDAGFPLLALERAGGYYLDVGASQMIIDGKIKLKNDSPIKEFTPTGLKFENGSELPADVVLFATGFDDPRVIVRKICGDEIADKTRKVWGMNEEGEQNAVWRDCGVEGMWFMLGNLAMCRFHSKHVALQIKAIQENLFGSRYTI